MARIESLSCSCRLWFALNLPPRPKRLRWVWNLPVQETMRTAVNKFARMIATSLVFLATAAFVLQGAALAQGHRHADAPCHTGSADTAAHSHDAVPAHSHAADAVHSHDHLATDHASQDTAKSPGHDHASANADSCCGKFCSPVVCVESPELAPLKFELQSSQAVQSQVPQGIGPSGLRRPPRTLGIA